MARVDPKNAAPANQPAKGKASSVPNDVSKPSMAVRVHGLALRRRRVLVIVAVIASLSWGVQAVWRRAASTIAHRERYLLRGDSITTTTTPEWIVADIRQQVIHKSALDGRLSILDPRIVDEIRHAFALHPWVGSVTRVEKKFPPAVHVELAYRRPVAVIDTPAGASRELLPVDVAGVHLPAEDVPLIRRQYLPRITNIAGRPAEGQRWEDPRVPGAVELANMLRDCWEPLHLMEITPSARLEVRNDYQYFVYEIVTRGGTRIIWGAAPSAKAPGEAGFEIKLARLRRCAEQYGPLNSVNTPGAINVRGEPEVKPRIVKKPGNSTADETVLK